MRTMNTMNTVDLDEKRVENAALHGISMMDDFWKLSKAEIAAKVANLTTPDLIDLMLFITQMAADNQPDNSDEQRKAIFMHILSIDAALGVGGLPKGRIIEIYGPESSGKTTIALHAAASCQKIGGTVAFIDAEHAMDPKYAEKIGVDLNEIYVSQPDNGEQALDIAEALIRSGAIDMVIIDSVAALVPKAEIEGDMGDSHVGLQARLMSQALRKLTAVISNTSCVVIFINQLREKVGVMYGNPETTTGGKALKFYATIRIDVRKTEPIKNGKEIIGNRTKIKIVKNKVAPPFKTVVVDMLYGEGISRIGDMLDIAVNMDIIKKAGSFYSLTPEHFGCEDRIGQGRDNARQYLVQNPDLADKVSDLKTGLVVTLRNGYQYIVMRDFYDATGKSEDLLWSKNGCIPLSKFTSEMNFVDGAGDSPYDIYEVYLSEGLSDFYLKREYGGKILWRNEPLSTTYRRWIMDVPPCTYTGEAHPLLPELTRPTWVPEKVYASFLRNNGSGRPHPSSLV